MSNLLIYSANIPKNYHTVKFILAFFRLTVKFKCLFFRLSVKFISAIFRLSVKFKDLYIQREAD